LLLTSNGGGPAVASGNGRALSASDACALAGMAPVAPPHECPARRAARWPSTVPTLVSSARALRTRRSLPASASRWGLLPMYFAQALAQRQCHGDERSQLRLPMRG
jgi:hypothetical protein